MYFRSCYCEAKTEGSQTLQILSWPRQTRAELKYETRKC